MTIQVPSTLLKPISPKAHPDWSLWEKKNFNIHRGIIELPAFNGNSIHDLAGSVRDGVRDEFRPGWFRGFGFGVVAHFQQVPADFTEIVQHVDTRNKSNGVWQWVIACFDEDQVAVGIHTWLHGYLRPVYETLMQEFKQRGYKCQSTDAEMDALTKKLHAIAKYSPLMRVFTGAIG